MPAKKIKKTIERDVSWMYFNHRILQEAQRPEVPLLERLSFVGIYSNNLDEFFRVRVATLSRIAENDHKFLKDEVSAAKKTLKQISKLYAEYDEEFTRTVDSIFSELASAGMRLVDETGLDGRIYLGSGWLAESGYYTVDIEKDIALKEGTDYAVIVDIDTRDAAYPVAIEYRASELTDTADIRDGRGYISADAGAWASSEQEYQCNVCLKAFTDERNEQ